MFISFRRKEYAHFMITNITNKKNNNVHLSDKRVPNWPKPAEQRQIDYT